VTGSAFNADIGTKLPPGIELRPRILPSGSTFGTMFWILLFALAWRARA
jgi:hypothetical protein